MKRTIFLAFVIGITMVGQAQTKTGKVNGVVVDGNTKTVEASTITLLRAKDSSVAKLSVADKTGKFEFDNIIEGRYLVSVTAVGHQKGYSETFEITPGSSVVLKTIELIPITKSLTGVTITAKKPLIEQKIDRTVVNVDAAITNVGSSALEVLEKSPGITVDKDGNISLKGKQGVQIYIDGRPSYLSGQDLVNLLKNMNANQLEQIEIMTNPPAKYDAAGNSGIINIKTKKNKQMGYNGSVSVGYTQGYYPRTNESFNFNYRTGKVNLFTNLSHSYNHRYEVLDIQRNFIEKTTKDITSTFDQEAKMTNENQFYSAKIGIDYNVSKKTTIGAVASSFINPRVWESNTATDIYNPDGSLRSKAEANSRVNENWKNVSGNINFRHTFDSTGQELTADIDAIRYRSASDQTLLSRAFDINGVLTHGPDTLIAALPQDIRIYSGKIDYTLPLKKNAKFEAGVKTSYVETDNNAVYNNLVNNSSQLDSSNFNHFIYKERINAAYLNFSKPLGKKLTAQLGLRLENTVSKGHSTGYDYDQVENKFVGFDSRFNRNYTQLFPTAYFLYTMNEKNQIGLNYGRRIDRPDYGDLNPFRHFLDIYTYEQGNPNLKPQFAHNVELSHIYNGFITTTANYTSTTDIIQEVLEQHDSSNQTFIKKANIAKMRQMGISVSAFKEIKKWWSGSFYANFFNNQFEGIVNGTDHIKIGISTLVLQAQQQFKFGKGWGAEISGFYRTKGLEGVIFVKPIGQMNLGFSKQVMKNKGSIRLNVRDVLNSNNFKGFAKYGTVDAQFQNYNYSRSISINFTYRFSKGKVNNSQRRNGGAEDEQNRVKVGGN
jgi:iron complex outermembrane receptor protein